MLKLAMRLWSAGLTVLVSASAWPQLETTSLFIKPLLRDPPRQHFPTRALGQSIRFKVRDVSSFKALCSAGPRINLRLIGRMTGAGSSGKPYWTGGIFHGRSLAASIRWWIVFKCTSVLLRGVLFWYLSQDVTRASILNSSFKLSIGWKSIEPKATNPEGRNRRETQPGKQNKPPTEEEETDTTRPRHRRSSGNNSRLH